jgi:hypothetical protein
MTERMTSRTRKGTPNRRESNDQCVLDVTMLQDVRFMLRAFALCFRQLLGDDSRREFAFLTPFIPFAETTGRDVGRQKSRAGEQSLS